MAFRGTPTSQETDGICWECTILERSWAISWGEVLKNSCFSGSAEYLGRWGEGKPTIQRFPYVWQGWSQHRKGLPYSGHHQCYISIPILKQSATTLKIVIRCTSTPLPPPKKMHATFYFRTKKRRNKKVNNFKSHLSVGFFTRNYTCLA